MKSRTRLGLLVLCPTLGFLALPAQADLPDPATKDKVPPIAMVQANVWKRLDLADFTLTGSIHSDKSKTSYPIVLRTKGHELVYEFTGQPLQIKVQIDPGSVTVQKRSSSSGSWGPVTASDKNKAILNTDITYEDLGLDFVNWDDIQPLGTDNIKTLDAFVFEAKPGPNNHSRYASVRFWVSKKYWAFLRIDGINAKGQTVKRVEVQNVMQVADNYYVFKQMKVANMQPDKDDIASSTTFIDIDKGTKGSGLTQ